MNVDLQTDFKHELSRHQFPFLSLIKKQDSFLQALLLEFAKLPLKPKLHWYFIEFISDEEWAHKSSEPGMEAKANKIISEFNEAIRQNNVSEKHLGRFILETATVKSLILLHKKLIIFKKYVFTDANRDNYKEYARAAAKSMILICSKIGIPELSRSLLQEIADMDVEADITMEIFLLHIDQARQEEIRNSFDILKTMADELINDEIRKQSSLTPQAVFFNPKEHISPEITLPDRTLREVNIIYDLFNSQYSKYEPSEFNPYPMILDKDGRSGINGNYLQRVDIWSDCELFNVQAFKKQITERFEQSTNHVLLKNQLSEICAAAQKTLDFYNQKLTKSNPIVDGFLSDHNRPLRERFEERDKYAGLMTVYNYHIGSIYFGADGHSINRLAMHITDMKFNYPVDNISLTTVCQHIISFIEKLDPPVKKYKRQEKNPENQTSIFRDNADEKQCLDLLKKVKPAVIDEQGAYTLTERKKSAIVAWFNALDEAHKIDNSISPDHRTALIQTMIPNLKITSRAFRNKQGVYHYYFPLFKKMTATL
jgi:hypothetical protein